MTKLNTLYSQQFDNFKDMRDRVLQDFTNKVVIETYESDAGSAIIFGIVYKKTENGKQKNSEYLFIKGKENVEQN